MEINVGLLVGIVEGCMVSCETYYDHIREEHKAHYGETYSWWQHWNGVYSRDMDTHYRNVSDMCEMLGFEMDSLVSIVKSIHRKEKALGWERCFDVEKCRDSFLYNIKEIDLFAAKLSTFRVACGNDGSEQKPRKIWEEYILLGVKGWLP